MWIVRHDSFERNWFPTSIDSLWRIDSFGLGCRKKYFKKSQFKPLRSRNQPSISPPPSLTITLWALRLRCSRSFSAIHNHYRDELILWHSEPLQHFKTLQSSALFMDSCKQGDPELKCASLVGNALQEDEQVVLGMKHFFEFIDQWWHFECLVWKKLRDIQSWAITVTRNHDSHAVCIMPAVAQYHKIVLGHHRGIS